MKPRSSDEQKAALERELQRREPGVTDVMELYSRVEAIYSESIKALEERQPSTTSNSTNVA